MDNRRGFAPVLIALIIAGILVVGGIWYYEANRASQPQPNVNQPSSATTSVATTSTSSTTNAAATTTNTGTSQTINSNNKIAFLKSGEVWLANEDGTGAQQITNTSGSVYTFTISPDSTYLEYSTGNSLLGFVDLSDETIVKKITSKDFGPVPNGTVGEISFVSWISGSEFETVFTEYPQEIYDAQGTPTQDLIVDLKNPSVPIFATSTRQFFNSTSSYPNASVDSAVDWGYADGSSVGDTVSLAAGMYWGFADFSSQNNYVIYDIDSSTIFYGVSGDDSSTPFTFYAFDPSTKQSNEIGTWNSQSVIDVQLNHEKNNFAILRQNLPQRTSIIGNELWLYNNGTPLEIYSANSLNDGFFRWSFDDKYIALRLDEPNGSTNLVPKIVVIDVSNPTGPKVVKEIDIPGDVSYRGMQWTRDDKILFTWSTVIDTGNIYEYDLQTGTTTLIATSSYQPFAL